MWNKADRISRTELQQNYPDASRFNETNGNVAAIDFGATFCSLAFALVGNSDMKSVEINTVKFNGYYARVPTVILLRELKWTSPPSCDDLLVSRTCDYEVVSFGYDAVTQLHSLRASQRSHYLYFEEFKMRLQQYEVHKIFRQWLFLWHRKRYSLGYSYGNRALPWLSRDILPVCTKLGGGTAPPDLPAVGSSTRAS